MARWYEEAMHWEPEEIWPQHLHLVAGSHAGTDLQLWPVLGLELQSALASPPRHQHSTMIKESCDKRQDPIAPGPFSVVVDTSVPREDA